MGKTIAFNENSLMVIKKKLNEIMVGTDSVSHNDVSVNEAAPEADEYEIGAEPNSPVGGVYYHIKQEEKNLDESKISGNEREEDRRIISLAVEEFGVTDDVIKAGYILPDGSFLDFDEGEGYRTIDHRNIEGIFKENGIEHEYRSEYVSDFLNCGAIRCCCMTGLLNMQREPTSEQYSSIENFVRFVPSSTYINVGFDNSQGDEEHYACYLNPNPKMVISDIYKYYNEGIKPQGNACYESKKNKSAIISEKQLKTIKENLESGVIAENSTDRRVNAIISKYANVNDFQEIRNIRSKILKLIPNARAKNDKYLGAVAMYYLTGCLNDREDAFKLNYLLGKVAKYPSPSGIYGKTDFGMVPFEVIKQEMEWLPSENVVNSYKNTEKIKRVGNYTIMRMDSYDDTAFVDNNLEVDVPWRIFNDEETYFNMTDGYTVYVCIRDGYENIDMMKYEEVIQKLSENNLEDVKESILEYYPEEEQWPDFVWDMADSGEYAADSFFGLDSYKFGLPPCDDYGLSMFVVLVSNFDCAKGEIGGVYSRYNLPNLCDGDIMTDKELSELLGADCNSVFPPHITSENVNENIEKEVESSEVDLSSFKKKESLQPKIWKDEETLDSRIRLKLLDIADDFWEFVNLTWVEPKGIIITGSICNFNWSEFSDIDLHLIVDFEEVDEKVEFVKQYFDMKKNEWNKEHGELTIMGFPVELYVQDVADEVSAGGIYDIEENKWIRKPDFDDVKSIGLNKFSIKDKAAEIMTIIDDMWDAINDETDSHRIEEIGEDADYLWKKIKEMRKNSLEENGENGSGNIVYKCLRRFGYLEKIWKLRTLCYDKVNSITESKEVINEYLEKNYNLPLYKYFKWAEKATSCEKAEDLAYSCSYYITEYISDLEDFVNYEDFEALLNEEGEFDYEDDEAVENFLSLLEKNRLCDHFVANIVDIVNSHGWYEELPAWCTMDFNRVVKNEWCIHFGADSYNIAREGFTGGTEDISHLAYTGAGREKSGAGYNFAFAIGDRDVDNNNYGDEAVIFRTSGVEVRHYGDEQNQVVFWGPNAKDFIPIKWNGEYGAWVVEGLNGQILKTGKPSEIAAWAITNLPQYRKQIMAGKNGFIPKYYDINQRKKVPYPIYRNESIKKYLTLLKENTLLGEEFNADGNTEHNPYKERWEAEREALKNFICNYGMVMQSKEDNKEGKLYKCYWDKGISELIGYNYCLCVQWDPIQLKPKSVVYIRALDKFSQNIKQVSYDYRGFDNQTGTYDDLTPNV